MGQLIIDNMWVYPGPSLSEPGALLQISGMGVTEWHAP